MKNLSSTIILLVLTLSINAQTDSCKVLLRNISGTYSGNCLNGLANGKGTSTGEDTYTGVFKDGLPDGKGKYQYKNGDVYQGYWKNGQKDGKGKFEYTLNGKKTTLVGYWRKDEYVGVTDPGISYKVTASSGIVNYKVERMAAADEQDREVAFTVKSAFTDHFPADLKIEKSSGRIVQTGKKVSITQYLCPLHCEISYSVLLANTRKQCRFIIEIYDEGSYSVTLMND